MSWLGCKVGSPPLTYLGLPLGFLQVFTSLGCSGGKISKKNLLCGKKQYLSKGERLTLIKSTLFNLSIYYISFFVIPRKVSLRLEKKGGGG